MKVRVALFCHSLLSDWNHGNAHFLRGVVSELQRRGHYVEAYEAQHNWSLDNLLAAHGEAPVSALSRFYPDLVIRRYEGLDLDRALDQVDLVLVHEWNPPELVRAIGLRRAQRRFCLLFHDTHHRSVSAPTQMRQYDLSHYDGVLAFGEAIRHVYLESGWTQRAWTWHEAADTRVFFPKPFNGPRGDLVWIGNWGDEERSEELHEFFLRPSQSLGLHARVFGVRYSDAALRALDEHGVFYEGWLPNFRVPEAFACHRATVHVPRHFYAERLRGIPTIRVFEALACGIPLVSAPWHDDEGLFKPNEDYLVARDGIEMQSHLKAVLNDEQLSRALIERGLNTIRERHTCAHRVDQLLEIVSKLQPSCLGETFPRRESPHPMRAGAR